ncbi:MAG TPA: trypsin-like peptidase domain-containing protein [Gemmatimonadales bacterium]|jgi:serine protease Do|nr:trypsin-like peptidase domain-containing protein [Gemmatimonadales bacterium]
MRRFLALTALAALAGCDRRPEASELVAAAEAQQRPARQVSDEVSASRRTAIVEAAQRVSPSVVSITVYSRRRTRPQSPFDFFFIPEGREEVVPSFGTGFIIRPDGAVLTNQHVVSGAERIIVTLPDGSDVEGTLLGEDAVTDIAVIRTGRNGLPPVTTGRSTDLLIGEWVVALGNPFAYLLGNTEPTVTAGVVSATGRNILPSREQTGLYLDMIQTDAAINPGNSGGPLANALGEVVGVNSSILTQSGGSIGLGFAIPIERALRVADEIIRKGAVRRAWVGFEVAGADRLETWKSQGGVLVVSVADGGPADQAGLRPGDVLTRAGSRVLRNYLDWEAVKLDLRVGDRIPLTVRRRDGKTVEKLLTAGDLPTVTAEKVTVLKDLQLVTVTPQVRAERGIQSEWGALVFRISRQLSQASSLREGDVILAMNRRLTRSAEDVQDEIGSLRPGQAVRVVFERAGQVVYTDLIFQ